MNGDLFQAAEGIVSKAYANQAASSRRSRERLIKALLTQKSMPKKPWDERTISLFMAEISSMDSNNFPENSGVGEREGRVFSPLVRARHHGLAHGIGRSGDVGAIQPKAAGSSLLMKLATAMTLHAIKVSGGKNVKACLLLPVATGMAHLLTFCCLRSRLRNQRKGKRNGNELYVVWPRIDQKTCLKSIVSAGLTPLVIENIRKGDLLKTDLKMVENEINRVGPENVLCVLSTASCFAPRSPDNVQDIAKICKKMGVAHVINNAYGLQSPKIMGRIDLASRVGRVDCFIQSTDKNLMVPVGGAIIAGYDRQFIQDISQTYPGRASMAPVMDVFLTLVSMGELGYKNLVEQRRELFVYLKKNLSAVGKKYGERVLDTDANPISLALTIDSLKIDEKRNWSYVGSMLFQRCVSGPRSVPRGVRKSVCGIEFIGYGSHCNNYPHAYIALACAIGMTKSGVDLFLQRLEKTIKEIRKEQKKLEGVNTQPKKKYKAEEDKTRGEKKKAPRKGEDIPKKSVIHLPATILVGSYGGGTAMQMSRMIYMYPISKGNIPPGLIQGIQSCLPRGEDFKSLKWHHSVQVSSRVYGSITNSINLMAHGRIFHGAKSLKNLQKYPMFYFFAISGVETHRHKPGLVKDPAVLVEGEFRPADQHVHTVDIDPYPRFGSDMAKIFLDLRVKFSTFTACCYDKVDKTVEVVRMIILDSDLESIFDEKAMKKKKSYLLHFAANEMKASKRVIEWIKTGNVQGHH